MDPINKPQEIFVPPDIPTPEEHSQEVRKIFTICISTAVMIVLLSVSGVFAALSLGVKLQTLAFVVPIVMGIGISAFAIGYGIPVGLISLRRLEIAYRMGYFGLKMNRDVTSSMKSIADRVSRETDPVPVKKRTPAQASTAP